MTPRILVSLMMLALCSCGPDPQGTPGQATRKPVPEALCDSPGFSGDNALYHAAAIVAIGDRAPASPGYRAQLDYLTRQLSASGWTCEEQSFALNTAIGPVNFVNLRARYTGASASPAKARLIVSCHIDTKTGIEGFTGANDGASGAAVILELARVLAREPGLASQTELVFFDGEESFGPHITSSDGLYGSTYYVSRLQEPLPSWLVNLDMVGRQGMKIRIPPDTPQQLYEIYREAVDSLKLSPRTWGVADNGIIDDHIPFARKGIPALNIIDDFGDGAWWHTAHDNLGILSAASLGESGRVTLFIIKRLLE